MLWCFLRLTVLLITSSVRFSFARVSTSGFVLNYVFVHRLVRFAVTSSWSFFDYLLHYLLMVKYMHCDFCRYMCVCLLSIVNHLKEMLDGKISTTLCCFFVLAVRVRIHQLCIYCCSVGCHGAHLCQFMRAKAAPLTNSRLFLLSGLDMEWSHARQLVPSAQGQHHVRCGWSATRYLLLPCSVLWKNLERACLFFKQS